MSDAPSIAVLLLRAVAGAAFVLHGWPKIQHPFSWMGANARVPAVFQALAATAEFAGGLGWILGLLTPVASFGIACTMVVAIARHAIVRRDPFVDPGGSSYELAAIYLCLAVLLLVSGAGRFSVDHLLPRHDLLNPLPPRPLMSAFSVDSSRTPQQAFRLDCFVIPDASRAPFLERMQQNMAFIRTLPGFRGHVVLEKRAGATSFSLVTLAVWEDQQAIEAAGKEVRAYYQRIGFDMPGALAAWGIQMVRGDYEAPPGLQ